MESMVKNGVSIVASSCYYSIVQSQFIQDSLKQLVSKHFCKHILI